MGLCEEGRHLRDYSANKDEAEDVDCEDEENYESDHCMRRRLRREYIAGEDDDEADYCADYNMIWDE